MLPAKNRLDLAREFRRFKNSGSTLESPYFRMVYLPTLGEPRFGFVITSKTGKAVERNRARRLLREMVKLRLNKLVHTEAVFIGRRRLTEAKLEEVLASFDKALSSTSLSR
jgi:ribonuclease P protein component